MLSEDLIYVAVEGLQIFNVLKAVTEIAEERMVQMLQHSSLANDVPHAF